MALYIKKTVNDTPQGPIDADRVRAAIAAGKLTPDILVSTLADGPWVRASACEGLTVCNTTAEAEPPLVPHAASTAQWYYATHGQKCGPLTTATLRQLATAGTLAPTDLVWRRGLNDWILASSVDNVFPQGAPAEQPPPISSRSTSDESGSSHHKQELATAALSDKWVMAAGIALPALALFVGVAFLSAISSRPPSAEVRVRESIRRDESSDNMPPAVPDRITQPSGDSDDVSGETVWYQYVCNKCGLKGDQGRKFSCTRAQWEGRAKDIREECRTDQCGGLRKTRKCAPPG